MWANNTRTGSWPGATKEWQNFIASKTMKEYRFGVQQVDKWKRDGTVMKRTIRGAPAFNTNYFRLCDEEDPARRFGLWNHQDAVILNMLRPLTNNQREVNIRFVDFRDVGVGGVTASNTWCTVGTAQDLGKLGVCTLRYCFDFNTFYETGRQALTPNDFAENCFKDVLYDMDGNQIADEETWQDFGVFMRIRDNMLSEVFNGTGVLGAGSAAKGLKRWFSDFATDHPEIAPCPWIAPKYVVAGIACQDIGKVVEERIRKLRNEFRDVRMQGNAAVQDDFDENSFVLVLSEKSAECVVKCHICATVCAQALGFAVSTPDELRQWKMLYPHYLTGGRFGQGYIVTPNGMSIDIMTSRRLADTDMFLIFNGSASDPEAGLRLAPFDYTPYINYLTRNEVPVVSTSKTPHQGMAESIYGGAIMSIAPSTLCADRMFRWNWQIVDRKPWMQSYWSALDTAGCDALAPTVLADSPDVTAPYAANCP